jgi:hypothetical protein
MNNDVHCLICNARIDDTSSCARMWVQRTPSSLETDLGYYVHEACCKTIYDSHIISPPVLHFSTTPLEVIVPPSPPLEDLVQIFSIGGSKSKPKDKVLVAPTPVVLYPVQHHTDSSRPPILHSRQCLRDL